MCSSFIASGSRLYPIVLLLVSDGFAVQHGYSFSYSRASCTILVRLKTAPSGPTQHEGDFVGPPRATDPQGSSRDFVFCMVLARPRQKPYFWGVFLRSGRPRGPGKAFKKVGRSAPRFFGWLPRAPGAGQISKTHPQNPARLPSGTQA